MSITSSKFVKGANTLLAIGCSYKLGTFFNKRNMSGKYQCDCSGVIKAIFWGYPKGSCDYESNGLKDINANTMIKNCTSTSTDFSKIVSGAIVWLDGHIGIYVGNGIVIESTPKWKNGIQKTYCKGSPYSNNYKLNERKWTKWGKFKYVEYATVKYYKKYSGDSNSLVDALKAVGVSSTLTNRKKIAKANGISNYSGTSEQNVKLLKLLKEGKLIKY